MSQYLISLYQPDGQPTMDTVVTEDGRTLADVVRDVTAVAADMQRAGAWVFSAGLYPPDSATVVRIKGGQTLMTDGPFVESKEHLGGFTVVEAADLDEALDWARRMTVATGLPAEVRPVRSRPPGHD